MGYNLNILYKAMLAVIIIALFAAPALSDSISSEGMVSGGAFMDAGYYSSFSALGDGLVWPAAVISAVGDITAPAITYIKFDNRKILNNDYVRPDVEITSRVIDDLSGVNSDRSSIEVDSRFIAFSSPTYGTTFINSLLTMKNNFTDGSHSIKIHAYDLAGNYTASETIVFKVEGGEAKIPGPVLNYKNPFNPGVGETTNITYSLNNDADVYIYIYNLIGQLMKKIVCVRGAEGGRAGYNQVPWDGYSDSREIAANDAYYVRIVSNSKVIGKCKIAVLK